MNALAAKVTEVALALFKIVHVSSITRLLPHLKTRTETNTRMDAPRELNLTPEERRNGTYNPTNVQKALEGLHQDGLLVLKGVVDVDHVDHLREVMSSETKSIMADPRRSGIYNQGTPSNILQTPPVARKDCLYNDVWFNSYVVQIANA